MKRIVVIGSGPGGIAAAVCASCSGNDVILLDDKPLCGGQIWYHYHRSQLTSRARGWIGRLEASSVQVHGGCTVVNVVDDVLQVVDESSQQSFFLPFDKLILAAGAVEQFLPFPGWTTPGVTGVGGAQLMVKAGMDVLGKRVVVSGSGPLLFAAAATLAKGGARVITICEQAPMAQLLRFGWATLRYQPEKLLQGIQYNMAYRGAKYRTGHWIKSVGGSDCVESVCITDGQHDQSIACDMVACGFGLVPALELAKMLGLGLKGGFVEVDERQTTSKKNIYAVGEQTGIGGVDQAICEGEIAGLSAVGGRVPHRLFARHKWQQRFTMAMARCFALRKELMYLADADTVVCRCEDVAYAALADCPDARYAKMTTRCGMGPCQGRVCGPQTEQLFAWKRNKVQPPLFPVSVGSYLTYK